MILSNAPVNEAIVSNVSEIGEFRIRNSAKAFSILSSGLYANKIRAIIRELSCNAVDSHTAAGKKDVPFDVHLPNQLEPHFAIRDYGTGLSHEQVTQIYTTYFESTKTASNEFIGALGLGSKSPFSYTDNFTVTAIKDGKKGIYSAFINETGVPSIALMMQEESNDPSGVEVKFSVNDYYDFSKFRHEAENVYTHFALRPVVSGCAGFEFNDVDYETKDIVPGVHSKKNSNHTVAVMGNIAYPIDVPQESTVLGELSNLLHCGLELHFDIGELDFQASREGLSYIPQTITAIKSKLEKVNDALVDVLAKDLDAIDNLWKRALELNNKRHIRLWSAAAEKYAADSNLPTYSTNNGRHHNGLMSWHMRVEDLAKNYNISIRGIQRSRYAKTLTILRTHTEYDKQTRADGTYETWQAWPITVASDLNFVISNSKTRGIERVKYHYREQTQTAYSLHVYVLEPADRTKAMNTDEFFKAISNPPADQILNIDDLLERPKTSSGGNGLGQNVNILRLEKRSSATGYWRTRNRDSDMVWRDGGKLDSFDKKNKFYYVPLSGFEMVSSVGYTDAKDFYSDIQALPDLYNGKVYGVRKGDIEEIKKLKNWINLEKHVADKLTTAAQAVSMGTIKARLSAHHIFNYEAAVVDLVDANSPFAKVYNAFKGVESNHSDAHHIQRLFKRFAANAPTNPDTLVNQWQAELDVVHKRYPLLRHVSHYSPDAADIADYINMIDTNLGI
jgi:hypothetical protein